MPRKKVTHVGLLEEVEINSRIHDCKHCRRCIEVDEKTGRVQCGRHALDVSKGVVSVVPYQSKCAFYLPPKKVIKGA